MQHSTWDLEVHAREMQQRRLREADRARQIEAARQCDDRMRVPTTRLSISRLMAAIRGRFTPQRRLIDGAAVPALPGAALLPLALEEPRLSPDARSGALSHPYAGMVVLARGSSAQNSPQPCAAADC
jgi:hypothetical protein